MFGLRKKANGRSVCQPELKEPVAGCLAGMEQKLKVVGDHVHHEVAKNSSRKARHNRQSKILLTGEGSVASSTSSNRKRTGEALNDSITASSGRGAEVDRRENDHRRQNSSGSTGGSSGADNFNMSPLDYRLGGWSHMLRTLANKSRSPKQAKPFHMQKLTNRRKLDRQKWVRRKEREPGAKDNGCDSLGKSQITEQSLVNRSGARCQRVPEKLAKGPGDASSHQNRTRAGELLAAYRETEELRAFSSGSESSEDDSACPLDSLWMSCSGQSSTPSGCCRRHQRFPPLFITNLPTPAHRSYNTSKRLPSIASATTLLASRSDQNSRKRARVQHLHVVEPNARTSSQPSQTNTKLTLNAPLADMAWNHQPPTPVARPTRPYSYQPKPKVKLVSVQSGANAIEAMNTIITAQPDLSLSNDPAQAFNITPKPRPRAGDAAKCKRGKHCTKMFKRETVRQTVAAPDLGPVQAEDPFFAVATQTNQRATLQELPPPHEKPAPNGNSREQTGREPVQRPTALNAAARNQKCQKWLETSFFEYFPQLTMPSRNSSPQEPTDDFRSFSQTASDGPLPPIGEARPAREDVPLINGNMSPAMDKNATDMDEAIDTLSWSVSIQLRLGTGCSVAGSNSRPVTPISTPSENN